MSINLLLSTIVLVSFLVTIVMAVGSYVAYKLREARRPQLELPIASGDESPYFERITASES
jgi:heme/copper-type cytochrome/quinol oxidase subunit 2